MHLTVSAATRGLRLGIDGTGTAFARFVFDRWPEQTESPARGTCGG